MLWCNKKKERKEHFADAEYKSKLGFTVYQRRKAS